MHVAILVHVRGRDLHAQTKCRRRNTREVEFGLRGNAAHTHAYTTYIPRLATQPACHTVEERCLPPGPTPDEIEEAIAVVKKDFKEGRLSMYALTYDLVVNPAYRGSNTASTEPHRLSVCR